MDISIGGIEMKPKTTNRNRAYYRHHRRRVIKRKWRIALHNGWFIRQEKRGKLSKGKVHCSCKMCQAKTRKLGFPINQQAIWDDMNKQIQDYMVMG